MNKANLNFYLDGYKLAINNSECLFKVASNAATENIFGVACSLNVLSAEEAIKAVCLMIKHYNPKLFKNPKDFRLIFKDHKTKHDGLIEFLKIEIENINKSLKFYLKILEEEKEVNDKIPIEFMSSLNQHGKDVHNHGKKVLELSKYIIDVKDAVEWLKNANTLKNDGLYVDQDNFHWKTPQSFNQEDYLKGMKNTEAIVKYARFLEYLYNYIKV